MRAFINWEGDLIMGIEKFDELARLVGEARQLYEEFANGKKVAATRCRQRLQEIKRLTQEARVEIQGMRKGPAVAPDSAAPSA